VFGLGGDVVASGDTGRIIEAANGVRDFAGATRDLFGEEDAAALEPFEAAFAVGRYTPTAFNNSRLAVGEADHRRGARQNGAWGVES
jgi:hypothetical protein